MRERAGEPQGGGCSDDVSDNGDRTVLIVGDTNNDGKADLWVVDTDNDGKADLFQFDHDGDGMIDLTIIDRDQDGNPDMVITRPKPYADLGSESDDDLESRTSDSASIGQSSGSEYDLAKQELDEIIALLNSSRGLRQEVARLHSVLAKAGLRRPKRRLDLERIIRLAAEIWGPAAISIWLTTPNSFLEFARPVDVLLRGDAAEVIEALESEAMGVHG
jgi:hypothetical protein